MQDSSAETAKVYDDIAEAYSDARRARTARHIVRGTLERLIGPVDGLETIDLACGDGVWTRYLKRHGASTALGVDLSERMVGLARAEEEARPLGCTFRVADIARFDPHQRFDLATAAFLLNYASTPQQLSAFCASVAGMLKPGTRFVGVNFNMFVDSYDYDGWKEIGRWITGPADPQEGDSLTVHLSTPDGPDVTFDNYYLKPSTYEAAFAEAGLTGFRWVRPEPPEAERASHDPAFWRRILDAPQIIGFEAVRSGA